MSTVLSAQGISKQVISPEGTLTILEDVSFAVSAGESVAVVGPSGAGKSTLLALLAFQSFHLVPSLNALENVMLPLELAGADAARRMSREIIDKVGLGDRWSHYPSQLSGGEKQRVAIARAFATEPAVLFADEPTGNLDSGTGGKIMELMFELNRNSSTTLVLVTHDRNLAERCDRVLSLDSGRLVSDSAGAA